MKTFFKTHDRCIILTPRLTNAQVLSGQAIDSLVERSMKAFDVPGIAVGVIKDGKVVHSSGYGVRSLNGTQKMDENSLFGIASNSKAFTTAALGMLVDEGKIKWDDKVRTHTQFKLYALCSEECHYPRLVRTAADSGLRGRSDVFPDGSEFTPERVITIFAVTELGSGFRSKMTMTQSLYCCGEVIASGFGKHLVRVG